MCFGNIQGEKSEALEYIGLELRRQGGAEDTRVSFTLTLIAYDDLNDSP